MTKKTQDIEDTILEIEQHIHDLQNDHERTDSSIEIKELEGRREKLQTELYSNLSPFEIVKIARHHLRPPLSDYISLMVEDFV